MPHGINSRLQTLYVTLSDISIGSWHSFRIVHSLSKSNGEWIKNKVERNATKINCANRVSFICGQVSTPDSVSKSN